MLISLYKIVVFVSAVAFGISGGYRLEEAGPVAVASSRDVVVAPVHNIHVTYTTLAVDGVAAMARVKYFKHDLEKAVALFAKQDSVFLGADPASDSLYNAYVDSTFVLSQNGIQLHAKLVGSGEEGEMWWYQLLYEAPEPISELNIVNSQLTESFRDQKNILKAENLSTGKRKSFYYNREILVYTVAL
jgi:hypothetical protein